MEENLSIELLKNLQKACEVITEEYKKQSQNDRLQFGVLQFFRSKTANTDIVRQAAQLYDEYEGNEEYIHIPDIHQMLYNLQHYPVLGTWDRETGELEGIVTIKYHENFSKEDIDPYYPKEGAKFFSITGVIVKQREKMLNKGIGTNLYAASILGVQKYATSHREENIDINVVIDCTNLPSLYALMKGNEKLRKIGALGNKMELDATLDAIYTVRDEENHLVEAPTYVIKIPVVPKNIELNNQNNNSESTFSFSNTKDRPNYRKYEQLLDVILEKVKRGKKCDIIQTEDKSAGMVSYISVRNSNIHLRDMRIERNGAENIGKKRIPRKDVSKFVGPIPDIRRGIEEGER